MTRRDDAAILRDRARHLARPPARGAVAEACDVLEFGLAGERYALEAARVLDVQPLRELAPLPGTPPFLRGIVNVHGALVGVVDLRKFFGLPERGIADLHRVVLLGDGARAIGLLADTVEGVIALDLATVESSLPTLGGIREDFVRGVTADGLVVLDAGAILADPRLVVDEEA